MSDTRHVPPLGFHFLTGAYDRVVAATMPERPFRSALVTHAAVQPGERVLEVGCGTGQLLHALATAVPEGSFVGLDPDAPALEIAREKLRSAGLEVELVHGTTGSAGLAPGSFDVVVSSLVLHHLPTSAKRTVLGDAHALLRPGGRVVTGDWGGARGAADRLRFAPVRLLDGWANTRANAEGRLPEILCDAGFTDVRETERIATAFGPLTILVGARARP